MTISLRNMTCEPGRILATNRVLCRMRTTRLLIGIPVWLMLSACGKTPSQPSAAPSQAPPPTPPPGAALTSVRVSGPTRVAPGEIARYTATADYADGASKDVTETAEWKPTHDQTWLPIYFTGPAVAQGANRGETNVGAYIGGKVGLLHVLVLDAGTFKLTGVVSESIGGGIPEVAVDVMSGTGAGLHSTTNGRGEYALYGVAGEVRLRASAEGFVTQIRDLVVTSDAASDAFALTPIDRPADISGLWTMTLEPSRSCRDGLPAIATGRTYQVEFIQDGIRLKVRTTSPTLQVYNPDANGNGGSILGSHVRFTFVGDTDYGDWSSTDLIDHLSPTETFGFDGTVNGTVSGSEIRATMNGDLVYMNVSLPTTSPWAPTWYCRAADHVVTLRR
jgi:hypothetical protein